MDDVQQAIIKARNAGDEVALEAGVQANLAITNAQNAYQQSLQETISALDDEAQKLLGQLQSMVNDFVSNVSNLLQTVTAQCQQIVNSLPFSNKEPQITSFAPHFVAPSATSYPVRLEFAGNFPQAGEDYFVPTLLINSHSIGCLEKTTQKISFSVPSDFLLGSTQGSPQYGFITVIVKIPWDSGWWPFGGKHTDNFSVIIGVIPQSPGHIQIVRQVPREVTRTQLYTSPLHTQHSDHDDDIDHPYVEAPDVGWTLVRGTFNMVPHGTNEGDWHWNFDSDYGNMVKYRVSTIHHGLGTSGKIDWVGTFTETKVETVFDTLTEDIALNWGDSKSFNYPAGTWKVIFDSFDGKHSEFNGADASNPYLTIKIEGSAFILCAADPSTLNI